jgi:hypothetical protein
MKFGIFSKFRTVGDKIHPSEFRVVGNKPATVKLRSQKAPKLRDPYMEQIQKEKNVKQLRNVYGDDPHKLPLVSLQQERITNIANKKISLKMGSNISRVRKAIQSKYPGGIKSINNFKKKAQAQRLEIKAFKLADLSGKRLQQKLSDKTGIGIRRFGSKATKQDFVSDDKARELGFPGNEASSSAKYKFAKSSDPTTSINKIQKILKQGGSWKPTTRSKLINKNGNLVRKPDFKFTPLAKKNTKVLQNRLKSFEYEQKINKAYSDNRFNQGNQPPTFLSNLNKQARLEHLFTGKSKLGEALKKQTSSLKPLSMSQKRNIYKRQFDPLKKK